MTSRPSIFRERTSTNFRLYRPDKDALKCLGRQGMSFSSISLHSLSLVIICLVRGLTESFVFTIFNLNNYLFISLQTSIGSRLNSAGSHSWYLKQKLYRKETRCFSIFCNGYQVLSEVVLQAIWGQGYNTPQVRVIIEVSYKSRQA